MRAPVNSKTRTAIVFVSHVRNNVLKQETILCVYFYLSLDLRLLLANNFYKVTFHSYLLSDIIIIDSRHTHTHMAEIKNLFISISISVSIAWLNVSLWHQPRECVCEPSLLQRASAACLCIGSALVNGLVMAAAVDAYVFQLQILYCIKQTDGLAFASLFVFFT